MSGPWIEELLQHNAEIVAADDEVTALLHRLRELHREVQDKSEAAGLLVTKLKRLLRPHDQRERPAAGRRHSMMPLPAFADKPPIEGILVTTR